MSNVNPLTYFKRIKKNPVKHVKIWPWAQSQRYSYENRKAIGCNKITVYILILSFQSASLVSRSPAIKCKNDASFSEVAFLFCENSISQEFMPTYVVKRLKKRGMSLQKNLPHSDSHTCLIT